MRFKIIVNSRSKSVVKRLSTHPSLHHGALFQSVVIIRQRRGVAAHLHAPVFFSALSHYFLQRGKRIKAARETRISIQLRQRFFRLVDGQHTSFESVVKNSLQRFLVIFCLACRDGNKCLLLLIQCFVHRLFCFSRQHTDNHQRRQNYFCLHVCKITL